MFGKRPHKLWFYLATDKRYFHKNPKKHFEVKVTQSIFSQTLFNNQL